MTSWIAMIGSAVIGSLLLMSFLRYGNEVTRDAYLNTLEHVAYQNLADATDAIEYELSLIGAGVNDPSIYPILSADSSEITFCWDPNVTGTIDTVKYHLSTTAALSATENPNGRFLYRTVNGGSPVVLAAGLTEFKIRYFNSMGYETSTLSAIRIIEFEMATESSFNFDANYSRLVWHGKVTPPNLYGK